MSGGTLDAQDCAITSNTASDVSVQQNSKPHKSARFSPISCDPNLLSLFSHPLPWPQWSVMKLLNFFRFAGWRDLRTE